MEITAIDAGNTHLRLAKINTNSFKNIKVIHSDYEKIFDFIDENPKTYISIASVTPKAKNLYHELKKKYEKTYYCERKSIEKNFADKLRLNYSQTLGIDRIVDAIAAITLFPNRDLVVIDSGTATTVDCINAKGEFLGGFVLPGIKITSEAIHEKTAELPYCNPYELKFSEMPNDTFSAVSSGLIADCAGGIEYAVDFCAKKTTKPPLAIACGGGWEIIKNFVRRESVSVPELTLIGTAMAGRIALL